MQNRSSLSSIRLIIYFIAAFLIAASIGLNAVIIPLLMEEQTEIFSSLSVTIILSAESFIAIIICFFIAKIIHRWGIKKPFLFFSTLRIIALIGMGVFTSVSSWFLFSIAVGSGSFFCLMIVQVCINHIKITRFKGLVYSLFGTVISLGIATGPILYSNRVSIMNLLNFNNNFNQINSSSYSFIISAIITFLFTVLLIIHPRVLPKIRKVSSFSLKQMVGQNKGVLYAVALCGISFFGVSWYMTIYGIRNDLSLFDSSLLLTAFMLGSVCLDTPISTLSEYFDRRYVLVYSALICTILVIFLPLTIYNKYQAYALLFLWGGLISGMYSNCLVLLEQKYGANQAIASSTVFSLMENTGAAIGLVFIGFLVNYIGTDGFSYTIILANLIYFSFVLINYKDQI